MNNKKNVCSIQSVPIYYLKIWKRSIGSIGLYWPKNLYLLFLHCRAMITVAIQGYIKKYRYFVRSI